MYRKGIPEVKFVGKVFSQLNCFVRGKKKKVKNMISVCERGKSKKRLGRGEKVHG